MWVFGIHERNRLQVVGLKTDEVDGEHENLKERDSVVVIEGRNCGGSWNCLEIMLKVSSVKGITR